MAIGPGAIPGASFSTCGDAQMSVAIGTINNLKRSMFSGETVHKHSVESVSSRNESKFYTVHARAVLILGR